MFSLSKLNSCASIDRRALSEMEARLREAEMSKAQLKAPSSHKQNNYDAVIHHHVAAPSPSLVAPLVEEASHHHGSAPLSLADLTSTVDGSMMHLPEVAHATSSPAHSPRIRRGGQPPSRSESHSPEKRAAAAVARVMLRVSGSLTHEMLRDRVDVVAEGGNGGSGRNGGAAREDGDGNGGSKGFVEKASTSTHNPRIELGYENGQGSDGVAGHDDEEGNEEENSGSSSSLDLPFHGAGAVGEFGSQGDLGSMSPPHPVRHRWPENNPRNGGGMKGGSTIPPGGSGIGGGVSFQSTQSTLERRRDELRLAIQGLSVQLTLALSDDEGSESSSGRRSNNDEQNAAKSNAHDSDESGNATRQALTLELRRKRAALIEVDALLERLQGPVSSNNGTNTL